MVGYRGRLMPSFTPTAAGISISYTSKPPSISRRTLTAEPSISIPLAPLTMGRPSP